LARDLYDLLRFVGLLPKSVKETNDGSGVAAGDAFGGKVEGDDDGVPPIILVGHSFGGLTIRAFQVLLVRPKKAPSFLKLNYSMSDCELTKTVILILFFFSFRNSTTHPTSSVLSFWIPLTQP
jgi:hypothetical protein